MEKKEFDFIRSYIKESSFDEEVACEQLRSLWTAYCLHHNVDADTDWYDTLLCIMWSKIFDSGVKAACWLNYEQFEVFMCRNLV